MKIVRLILSELLTPAEWAELDKMVAATVADAKKGAGGFGIQYQYEIRDR